METDEKMTNDWQQALVKLGVQFGVSMLPYEAEQYRLVLNELITLTQKHWPTDRAARRRMLSAFAVMLHYEVAIDETDEIREEE